MKANYRVIKKLLMKNIFFTISQYDPIVNKIVVVSKIPGKFKHTIIFERLCELLEVIEQHIIYD